MTLIFKNWLFCCLTFISLPAFSSALDSVGLEISEGYIRETIPGTSVSSAYLTINNTSDQVYKLIGVKSKVSQRLELHEHSMADGMMKMRQVPHIIIPANSQVTLKPSGLHIMIFELATGLKAGEKILLNFEFENIKTMAVTLPVQSIKQRTPHH